MSDLREALERAHRYASEECYLQAYRELLAGIAADRASRLPEMGEGDWPELPTKRRAMFCTKCGHSGPTDAEAVPTGAQCPKCNYMAFVEECDYSDDELHTAQVAAVEKYKALIRGKT